MNFTLCKNKCNYTKRNKRSRNPPSLRPTLPKPHYPSLRTKLASLVKGRWLDGTTQTVALLRPACDMSALFILQTFCRQDGGIAIPPFAQYHIYASLVKGEVLSPERIRATTGGIATPLLPKPHYTSKSTISLPPLSKVRCCRPKEFGRLPEGLPHHSFQNRTILRKALYPCLPCQR